MKKNEIWAARNEDGGLRLFKDKPRRYVYLYDSLGEYLSSFSIEDEELNEDYIGKEFSKETRYGEFNYPCTVKREACSVRRLWYISGFLCDDYGFGVSEELLPSLRWEDAPIKVNVQLTPIEE